jgi:hypothetical protein
MTSKLGRRWAVMKERKDSGWVPAEKNVVEIGRSHNRLS